MLPAKVRSVIDLAQQVATNTYVPPPSFQRIYSITIGTSVAVAGPKLASKYGACQVFHVRSRFCQAAMGRP